MSFMDKLQENLKTEVGIETVMDYLKSDLMDIEKPEQAISVLLKKLEEICGLLDLQNEKMKSSKHKTSDAWIEFKTAQRDYNSLCNQTYIRLKEDARKNKESKSIRITDAEFKAMADIEADVSYFAFLSAEKKYKEAQEDAAAEKDVYDSLNNHFLAYRKASDLILAELKHFSPSQTFQGMFPTRR